MMSEKIKVTRGHETGASTIKISIQGMGCVYHYYYIGVTVATGFSLRMRKLLNIFSKSKKERRNIICQHQRICQ